MQTTVAWEKINMTQAEKPVTSNEDLVYTEVEDIAKIYDALQEGFHVKRKTRSIEFRKQQIRKMQLMIEENHKEIQKTIQQDLGGHPFRGFIDMSFYPECDYVIQNLDKWTKDIKVSNADGPFLGKSVIRPEPKGVVLILAPWNYPFDLCFHVALAALAAGNCVCLKPSEMAGHTASLIGRLVEKYFDPDCFRVVQGAVPQAQELLKLRWDHIFYTGNGAVARKVLIAAAEFLTPVSTELGGKCPVIVGKSCKMDAVLPRISNTKWLNCGQTCVTSDYVIVHRSRLEELKQGLRKFVVEGFGNDPQKSDQWGCIINGRHVKRLENLVKSSSGKIEPISGSGGFEVDENTRYVCPTFVIEPGMDDDIMREEIFGPLLVILPFDDVKEAVKIVNKACPRPLALYVFTEDKKEAEYVLSHTQSGGACVNTVMEQVGGYDLPFGGFGESGFGAYHGKWGFDEFTHKRSILYKDTFLKKGAAIPNFPLPNNIYDLAVKFVITGFFTKQQRKQIKFGAILSVLLGLYLYINRKS